MNRLITLPRDALAELLKSTGSTMTPEEYVASLPAVGQFKKYPGRARAAAISKYCLLIVAVLAVVTLPALGFSFENLLIVAGLCTVTYFEFRVHRYFLDGNPEAPKLGFRNEGFFALGILVYCLFHAFAPNTISHEDLAMIEQAGVDTSTVAAMARLYLLVAIIAGGMQFALACYYRAAK